jgi:hypothetical protein
VLRIASILFALLVTLTLAGCGTKSTADKIAAAAKSQYQASSASCSKEGIVLFVGKREDVYDCLLKDVPPENRPLRHIASSSQRACFIYTDGQPFDVTLKLGDLAKAQKALGVTVDEFACLR